jgi:uncharacterized protein YcnI
MKCSAWSSLATSACRGEACLALALVLGAAAAALVVSEHASAHVTTTPPWVAAGDVREITLTAPNEREERMTGFGVTVPGDFRIVRARSSDGWRADVRGSTATWVGGSLEAGAEATFAIEVEAPAGPGPAALQAVQRYPGEERVRWQVALTVTPSSDAPSQNLGWAVLTALIGLGVLTAIGLALLRRSKSLQEK